MQETKNKEYAKFINELEVFAKENYVPIIKKEAAEYIKNILSLFVSKKIDEEIKKQNKNKKLGKELDQRLNKINLNLNILELGTAIGYSGVIFTKHILDTLKKESELRNLKIDLNLKYISVEKDENRFKLAKENLDKLEKDCKMNFKKYIKIYNEDAEEFLKKIKVKKEKNNNENNKNIVISGIDIAFIDANKSAYLNYYMEVSKLMNKKGIMLFDNILFNGWVFGNYTEKKHRTIVKNLRKFIKYLDENEIAYKINEKADGVLEINL